MHRNLRLICCVLAVAAPPALGQSTPSDLSHTHDMAIAPDSSTLLAAHGGVYL